jgi:hypothetical protein
MGFQKPKLAAAAAGSTFKADGTPSDCTEVFGTTVTDLCDGSDPSLMGWVDIYGRPCRKTGTPAQGFHSTCQYRRYVRYEKVTGAGAASDVWRVSIAVSHAPDGECRKSDKGGDSQCVVTSAILTR